MSDSQEETIGLDVVVFFVGLSQSFHQVYTFHTVVTKQAFGIVFGNELEICLPKRVLTGEELTCVKAIFCKVKKDNLI